MLCQGRVSGFGERLPLFGLVGREETLGQGAGFVNLNDLFRASGRPISATSRFQTCRMTGQVDGVALRSTAAMRRKPVGTSTVVIVLCLGFFCSLDELLPQLEFPALLEVVLELLHLGWRRCLGYGHEIAVLLF